MSHLQRSRANRNTFCELPAKPAPRRLPLYLDARKRKGPLCVIHSHAYRCNWRFRQQLHSKNSEIKLRQPVGIEDRAVMAPSGLAVNE
jgi:hypothetical protein